MEMNTELRAELSRLGWGDKLHRVTWGERLQGDMHGATVRLPSGQEKFFHGPFASVARGGQIAIVRWG